MNKVQKYTLLLILCLMGGVENAAAYVYSKMVLYAGEGGTVALAADKSGAYKAIKDGTENSYGESATMVLESTIAYSGVIKGTLYFYAKAQASTGYYFSHWSKTNGGESVATDNPWHKGIKSGEVSKSKAVTETYYAVFGKLYNSSLTVVKKGDGAFTINDSLSNPATTKNSRSNSHSYKLEAHPDAGNVFVGWFSDETCTDMLSNDSLYTYTITAAHKQTNAHTIYAKFAEKLIPSITGSNNDVKVGAVYTADYAFKNVSAARPSASSADDFYYTISQTVTTANTTGSAYPTQVIAYDPATNQITALNAGEATITFTQNETSAYMAAEQSFTVTVSKQVPNISGADLTAKVGEVKAAGFVFANVSNSPVAAASNGSNFYYSITHNVNPITTGSDEPTQVIAYDPATNQITALNAGEATITFTQNETSAYMAAEQSFTVTVTKNANVITVDGWTDNTASMPFDKQRDVQFTSNNDATRPAFVVGPSSDATIATYADDTITTTLKGGQVQWTIRQAEDYKYEAGNATMTVNVELQDETNDCYLMLQEDQVAINFYAGKKSYTVPDHAKELSIEIKKQGAGTQGFTIKYAGDVVKAFSNGEIPTSFTRFTFALDPAKSGNVEITSDGTLDKYFRNLYVIKKGHLKAGDVTHLNADDVTIDRTAGGNPICSREWGQATLTVDWSIANGGDLKIANDNEEEFRLSQTTITGVECESGQTPITVTYKENDDHVGTSEAHLIIYNDVYRKEVTLRGVTVKREQIFDWGIGDVETLGSEWTKAEAFTSTLSGVNGVTYSFSPSGIIEEDGDTLVSVAPGTVTITATVAGNSDYNNVVESKTVTISTDLVQSIVWNQTFTHLRFGVDGPVTLTATATSNEVCSTNGSRPIVYTSGNDAVVRVEGDVLTVMGIGTTTITATQAGGVDADGHTYLPATTVKRVVVKDPSAPCEAFAYEQSEEYSFYLGWNAADKQTKTYEIDFAGKEPAMYNFDYKGESKDVLIQYYDGTMSVDQYVNGAWQQVQSLDKPVKSSYRNTGDVALDRRATKMRVKVSNGMGYHYFTNCQVTLARYIETAHDELYFEARVGQNQERSTTLSFSNITGDVTLSLVEAGAPFRINRTMIEGDCGDIQKGIALTLSYEPMQEETDATYTLRITDGTTTHDVLLHATATISEYVFVGGDPSEPMQWGVTDNWEMHEMPSMYDRVIVRSDLVLTTEKSVYQMVIEDDATVQIAPEAGLTVGAGGIVGATENNLIMLSASAGTNQGQTGYLRISPAYTGLMPRVAMQLYSVGYYDSEAGVDNSAAWQYVGSPITAEGWTAKQVYAKAWVYGWDEESGTWSSVSRTEPLTPFVGYNTTQKINAAGALYEYKGTLVSNQTDVTLPLTYHTTAADASDHGFNMVANSFAAPIDITKFRAEDFDGAVEKTIYLFNTGSLNQWLENVENGTVTGTQAGQYVAIAPFTAGVLAQMTGGDLPSVIAPMQGFRVNATGAGASLHLNYERLVWNGDYSTFHNTPLRVSARENEEADSVRTMKLTLSANGRADDLYLLASEDYEAAFENGYDARKLMAGEMNIFATEGDEMLAIDATQSLVGTHIGLRTGDATEYTLSLSYCTGETVVVRDLLTDEVFAAEEGATYTFAAAPNSVMPMRFVIESAEQTDAPGIATEVENLTGARCWQEGLLVYVTGCGRMTVRMYDASGQLVTTREINDAAVLDMAAFTPGVYMLQLGNKVQKVIR